MRVWLKIRGVFRHKELHCEEKISCDRWVGLITRIVPISSTVLLRGPDLAWGSDGGLDMMGYLESLNRPE